MKIELVYPNITGHQSFQQGLAYIATSLKRKGHDVSLSDFTWNSNPEDHLKSILYRQPQLMGFTSLSGMMPFALDFARRLKQKYNVNIVFGGVHPTILPISTLKEDCVDYVCIGEGEESFINLIESIDKNEAYPNVSGICYKRNGQMIKSTPAPLVSNLDLFGYPDFTIYDTKKYIHSTNGKVDILLGRGCPYPCTYCVNHTFVKVLNNNTMKGYIRKNSVDFAISLIEQMLLKYNGIKHFNFEDDLFTVDREWLFEFLKKYKSLNTGRSFTCNNRVEICKKDVLTMLKNAGCTSISMGIETGNEVLRKKVLKRNMSNNKIIEAFKMAKEVGLPVTTYNILGIPGETSKSIWELIELNRKVVPDQIGVSIFCPYPGTEIFDLAVRENMINKDFQVPVHHRMLSGVKHPNLSRLELNFYKKSFRCLVFYKYYYKKALWCLFQDIFYGLFSRIRFKIPVNITRILYNMEDRLTRRSPERKR